MPPLEMTAPDPSMGNSKELFKMALADDRTMTTKMSPPGLDAKMMKELADATLDAIQLPGTSNSDATDNTTDLIGALKEIAEDKRTDWSEDRPRRNVQWKANNRTSLLSIKMPSGLQDRHGSFQGLGEEMYKSQVHIFEAVFSRLHWSTTTVQAWSQSNWFLQIGKDLLDHYMALHLHLVTLSNTEGWDYAQESLKHHGNKLAEIRKLAPSHLLCLVKTYIYLRDARKVDFYSPKLQEKRNKAMLAKIVSLEGGGSRPVNTGKNTCKKCGGEEVHSGGVKKCPFWALSDSDAKKRMGQLMGALAKLSPDDVLRALQPDSSEE